jgi:hypothetical protein
MLQNSLSNRRRAFFVASILAVVSVIFVAGFAIGSLNAARAAGTTQGLRVEGVATINVIGPNGQVLRQETVHNTLDNAAEIALCLSNAPVSGWVWSGATGSFGTGTGDEWCPGGSESLDSSYTQYVYVAAGTCTTLFSDCPNTQGAQVSITPLNCNPQTSHLDHNNGGSCTGWLVSAGFSPGSFSSSCSSYPCTVNVIGTAAGSGTSPFFDDIIPSSLTIPSSLDGLAINIQFTVS